LIATLLSGSKVAVLICLLGIILNTSYRLTILIIIIVTTCIASLFFLTDFEGSGIYFIDRLLWTFYEWLNGTYAEESSFAIRKNVAEYFFKNLDIFIIGSFDASRPLPQFSAANFDTALISINPHSLLIELSALFGFFGIAISSLLAISLFLELKKSLWGIKLWFVFLSILALTNVSSSILSLGYFFALTAAITNKN
jgi:hypothetical protein